MYSGIGRSEGVTRRQGCIAVAAGEMNGTSIAGVDVPILVIGSDGEITRSACSRWVRKAGECKRVR